MRKVLALWMAVAVFSAVGVVWVLVPGLVSAQEASATRSLPSGPVPAGSEVTVSITADGYGSFGSLVETLPAGFDDVTSSLSGGAVDDRGSTVAFTLFDGVNSFTYTVTASDTGGTYSFSGEMLDSHRIQIAVVTGDEEITVEPAAVLAASRSFSPASVALGGQVEVTINVSGYGASDTVMETLPGGFTYVSTSGLPDASVTESGQAVTFTLLDETSFTYTVTASDTAGDYAFEGVLTDEDDRPLAVGGSHDRNGYGPAASPGLQRQPLLLPGLGCDLAKRLW